MLRANVRLARQSETSDEQMVKKAVILLFNGVEETEFVITTNVLRRAGIELIIAGVENNQKPVKGCQNIVIEPDVG